jgi:hypothetical protein
MEVALNQQASIHFSMERGNQNHELGSGFFVDKRIISAVGRVEFVSNRMSYLILRGRWCDIIVLNVHAPTEDKIDGIKDRFYDELGQVFDQFPKHPIKIMLGDFNVKVCREDIFKPTIGNQSLHQISNDNGVRVLNCATFKFSLSKVRCSHIVTFMNSLGHLLMERHTTKLTIF